MYNMNIEPIPMRKLTLYRDDSTTQVIYERVKHWFFLANNTVLCIAQYDQEGDGHHYIMWPRERFCWFRDEIV
jgi:hypothetical protein